MSNDFWAGLVAGFFGGAAWLEMTRRVFAYRRKTGGKRVTLVARDFRAGPAPAVIEYTAWNAHLLYFARQCAPLERISEAAVTDAGIVDRVSYRIMARYMRDCGLWRQQAGPGGRPGKNRWVEWPPQAAIGRVRDAMRGGRLHLPYPAGRPPAIGERK